MSCQIFPCSKVEVPLVKVFFKLVFLEYLLIPFSILSANNTLNRD
jgi:hypothetical protein